MKEPGNMIEKKTSEDPGQKLNHAELRKITLAIQTFFFGGNSPYHK